MAHLQARLYHGLLASDLDAALACFGVHVRFEHLAILLLEHVPAKPAHKKSRCARRLHLTLRKQETCQCMVGVLLRSALHLCLAANQLANQLAVVLGSESAQLLPASSKAAYT